MLNYEPYFYDSETPEFDPLTARYFFWLFTSPEIAGFVRSLPTVQKVFGNDENTLWMVTLAPLHAQDIQTAQRVYNTVLVSIEAHLNPPMSEVWCEFVNSLEF